MVDKGYGRGRGRGIGRFWRGMTGGKWRRIGVESVWIVRIGGK
jgi:hypothetical protein